MKCPDCGVGVGEYHQRDCDWEDCPYCGLQLIGCEHFGAVPRDDRIPFTGVREAEKAAVGLGWYAVLGWMMNGPTIPMPCCMAICVW